MELIEILLLLILLVIIAVGFLVYNLLDEIHSSLNSLIGGMKYMGDANDKTHSVILDIADDVKDIKKDVYDIEANNRNS